MAKGKRKNRQIRPLRVGAALLVLLALVIALKNMKAEQPQPAGPAQKDVTASVPQESSITEAAVTDAAAAKPAESEASHIVYVTFDDGPCSNTPQVLDILDRYGVKATFFTVGCYVEKYPAHAAEIVRRGETIGCHSYTHDYAQCYASADAFLNEVSRWEQAVTSACGALPERECLRFPGGSRTHYADNVREGIKNGLRQRGIHWFDWNAGDNDKWLAGNTQELPKTEYFRQSYRACMKWFDDMPDEPVILLLHETENGTVQILPEILEDLISRGYVFRTLDQHPSWETPGT